MVCKRCGNEIQEGGRFCPSCGALNGPAPDGGLSQGTAPAWEGPEGGGGRKKTGLFIGLGAAAAAVIALVVVFASGLLASPKGQVEQAFAKSAAAYRTAEEKLALPDIAQWQRDQTIGQHMSLELNGINSGLAGMDLSALNGLGLRLDTSYNGPDRQLHTMLGAYWGEDDLFSVGLTAMDDELYLESNQLFGDVCYGMNTVTLGTDLAELTGDESIRGLSFNLFELMDMVLERVDQNAMEEAFHKANKALWSSAEVKKAGTRTLDINGASAKTTSYQVTISERAMDQYVDDLEAVLSAVNYFDLYEELYRAMGMPQDQIDEIMSMLEELDVYQELTGLLHDAVDETGDLELEVCLSDGYVSAVLYEDRISGSDVKVSVYLGGGGAYVDDISAVIETPSIAVDARSSGDHGLKSGVYTDETTVRIRQDGSTLARVTSDLTIDPKGQSDNFQWKLGVDSSGFSVFVLELSGSYQADKDRLALRSENLSLRAMGMELCTLALDYSVNCHPNALSVSNPTLITQMNETELERAVMDIQSNAMTWMLQMQQLFTTRLPNELLEALMYGF